MTLLFAALLGNFLACCVHALAWWLREKCLLLMVLCGTFITALCLPLTYFAIQLVFWNGDDLEPSYRDFSKWPYLFFVVFPWILCFLIAAFHKRLIIENNFAYARAFCALMIEIVVAIVACAYVADAIGDFSYTGAFALSWTFAITLLLLAFIRPQVVKVQKWLWQQVRPQRATNE